MPVPSSFKVLKSTPPHATGAAKGKAFKTSYALYVDPYMSRRETLP